MSYIHYSKVKDKYCLAYGGHCSEYLVQLRLLRPLLEKEFPGVDIYLSGRDDFSHLFRGEDRIIPYSQVKGRKHEFGYLRELVTGTTHPVLDFLRESKITEAIEVPPQPNQNKLCVIVTEAIHPTKVMSEDQIARCRSDALYDGYQVWVNPGPGALDSAGWVVGVESPVLFEAAGMGIRTTLVPTGIGTQLYKLMFPLGEIMKNTSR